MEWGSITNLEHRKRTPAYPNPTRLLQTNWVIWTEYCEKMKLWDTFAGNTMLDPEYTIVLKIYQYINNLSHPIVSVIWNSHTSLPCTTYLSVNFVLKNACETDTCIHKAHQDRIGMKILCVCDVCNTMVRFFFVLTIQLELFVFRVLLFTGGSI